MFKHKGIWVKSAHQRGEKRFQGASAVRDSQGGPRIGRAEAFEILGDSPRRSRERLTSVGGTK